MSASPATLTGKDGVTIAIGDRVRVDGSRAGTGIVDAVDVGAGKVWVRFDSTGTEYARIYWTDASDTVKSA